MTKWALRACITGRNFNLFIPALLSLNKIKIDNHKVFLSLYKIKIITNES